MNRRYASSAKRPTPAGAEPLLHSLEIDNTWGDSIVRADGTYAATVPLSPTYHETTALVVEADLHHVA